MKEENSQAVEGQQEVELTLETPEQEAARLAAITDQVEGNQADAEMLAEADAEATRPQIEEIRKSLGLSTSEVPSEETPKSDTDVLVEHYGEAIERDQNFINKILERKQKDLLRRTSGEISGVRLDELDKKNDEAIRSLEEYIADNQRTIQEVMRRRK